MHLMVLDFSQVRFEKVRSFDGLLLCVRQLTIDHAERDSSDQRQEGQSGCSPHGNLLLFVGDTILSVLIDESCS
jgi:hypothetical protein